MAKTPLTRAELERHLARQTAYLRASAAAFDNGFEDEAHRMAVVVRVLVHDTSQSTSLLTQLGVKHSPFLSTGYPYDPRNLMEHQGLVCIQMQAGPSGQSTKFRPILANEGAPFAARWVPFRRWWDETILSDGHGFKDRRLLSRSKLVLTMSNQDGGAHVDPQLDDFYADIKTGNDFGWSILGGENHGKPLLGVEMASMRQVAYEVLQTLQRIESDPPGPPPPPVAPSGSPQLTKRQKRRLSGKSH